MNPLSLSSLYEVVLRTVICQGKHVYFSSMFKIKAVWIRLKLAEVISFIPYIIFRCNYNLRGNLHM